jgi:hypothetical protein
VADLQMARLLCRQYLDNVTLLDHEFHEWTNGMNSAGFVQKHSLHSLICAIRDKKLSERMFYLTRRI